MGAPKAVLELVERYDDNRDAYRATTYNEAQLRREFLDPFFAALGWDVQNARGYAEPYKEVTHEDVLRIGGSTKAPDYSFRIGSARIFFMEAKRPAIRIRDDATSAYQLRRYGWSAKLALSVLTNFEEFAVYDCRIRPQKKDKAAAARVMLFTSDRFGDKWDELAGILSRDAVLRGSFDRFSASTRNKKGTSEFDEEFLGEIEEWRQSLAQNIVLRNPGLSERDLNTAVQKTIDRIIFLRICEDRGIETYGALEKLQTGSDVYRRLGNQFRDADDRYNSGLFHFREGDGNPETLDTFTLDLVIDDEPLKRISRHLYFPESPYEFSVISADILGQVYEQFLGRVIKLSDAKRRASVEEKPEVKKAGGVYYTPAHIVEFIVQSTLGQSLEGRTPKDIDGSRTNRSLRVLDLACGSGSFLVGAYAYLLTWYRDWYIADGPENHAGGRHARLYQGSRGDWRLTTGERRRILLTHIFGVDIDRQAVEVTKLSLLLKVLEGEAQESLGRQLRLFHERALPDLGENIKCGNSVVEPDFRAGRQGEFFDEENLYQINPFNWTDEFPAIVKAGGFDVVIGNPPYVDAEWMTKHRPQEREYCARKYAAASGNWDLFCVFIERALQRCKEGGATAFIVPNKLGSADYAAQARRIVSIDNALVRVRDYSEIPVFPVAVYPIVFVTRKVKPADEHVVLYEKMSGKRNGTLAVSLAEQLEFDEVFRNFRSPWPIFSGTGALAVVEKIWSVSKPLETVAEVTGAATVAEAYELKKLISNCKNAGTGALRIVNSGTIDPYAFLWGCQPLRYIKAAYGHPVLREVDQSRYASNRIRQSKSPKIVVAGMTRRLEAALDEDGHYLAAKSTTVILSSIDLRVLLGILNSRLMSSYYNITFGGDRLQGGYLRIGPPQLKTIPIVKMTDRQASSRLAGLVADIGRLSERKLVANDDYSRSVLERQIRALQTTIDEIVYEMYGLSAAERALLEGNKPSAPAAAD